MYVIHFSEKVQILEPPLKFLNTLNVYTSWRTHGWPSIVCLHTEIIRTYMNLTKLRNFLLFRFLPFLDFSIYLCCNSCMKPWIRLISKDCLENLHWMNNFVTILYLRPQSLSTSWEIWKGNYLKQYKEWSHQKGLNKVVQKGRCPLLQNRILM